MRVKRRELASKVPTESFVGYAPDSTSEIGKCGSIAWVQYPDYGVGTFTQIEQAASVSLRADHIIWDIYANSYSWSTDIEPFVAANPLPSVNAVCPSDYVSARGGCDTD
jgi:hypothetical protein